MARVSTEIKNGKLLVVSEYNAEWGKRAKTLGGKWQSGSKAWAFDPEDAAEVSAVLLDIYGEDGSGDVETCDITVRVDLLDNDQEITLCDLPVCRRRYRDEAVRMADGVILLSGGFPSSGGSVKNPRCNAEEGTLAKIKKVPVALAKKIYGIAASDERLYAALDIQDEEIPVCTAAEAAEKVGRETQLTNERDKLVAEIKKLQARVDEIDDELRRMVLIL